MNAAWYFVDDQGCQVNASVVDGSISRFVKQGMCETVIDLFAETSRRGRRPCGLARTVVRGCHAAAGQRPQKPKRQDDGASSRAVRRCRDARFTRHGGWGYRNFLYDSSSKPTSSVFPCLMAGARRLPVGPSMCAVNTSASGGSCVIENVTTLPRFATTTVVAPAARLRASLRPSLALASSVSLAVIWCSARNPCAFVQEFHPRRW